MNDFSIGAELVCAAVLFGGTLLVGITSLERICGRRIPRFRYSKAVTKERVFIVVPVLMIVVLIGSLKMLLSMRLCSHCSSPYDYQNPLRVVEDLVFAAGLAGSSGFALFIIVWIGCVVRRASAAAMRHIIRANRA